MADTIYYQGLTYTVEWYKDFSGSMKAKKYYENLSSEERKRLDSIVTYMADSPLGTRLPKTLYNLEDADHGIYAFKPKDHRFFNFITVGRKIVIIDAYRKHSQQMTKKDINLLRTVIACKEQYLKRVKGGN